MASRCRPSRVETGSDSPQAIPGDKEPRRGTMPSLGCHPRLVLGAASPVILVDFIFALGTSLVIYCSSHSRAAFSHELSAARFFSLHNNPENGPRV